MLYSEKETCDIVYRATGKHYSFRWKYNMYGVKEARPLPPTAAEISVEDTVLSLKQFHLPSGPLALHI